MKHFKELIEAKKYKKLMKIIDAMIKRESVHISQKEELYNLVVDEYEEMGDNPDDAGRGDVGEIYDISLGWPEDLIDEKKTPKWSISRAEFLDASSGYIKAQQDIIDELMALGGNKKKLEQWVEDNNADFIIVE